MKTTKKEKAKSKAKRAKRVKLKPTTRLMLRWAYHMRALYPHGRAFHARDYRERRRLGESNMEVLGIAKPSAEEKRKKIEAERAEYEAVMAELAAKGELPADTAMHGEAQSFEGGGNVVNEDSSTASSTLTPRRRKPRLVPQHRQAEFSFGSD